MTTIALSDNTAALLDCKKNLDECYATLGNVQRAIFGNDEDFEDTIGHAYAVINDAIMRLMTESIDMASTESRYKVI